MGIFCEVLEYHLSTELSNLTFFNPKMENSPEKVELRFLSGSKMSQIVLPSTSRLHRGNPQIALREWTCRRSSGAGNIDHFAESSFIFVIVMKS